jgi:hypothetical protein
LRAFNDQLSEKTYPDWNFHLSANCFVLPVAQAFQPVQAGWRAGTPAPLTFS